ncbi:MAG: hypothetical protein IJ368_09265 [Oscillospiraceae bacterium]|nr:hypothetical protein [Oscillospiraceae bacterium]
MSKLNIKKVIAAVSAVAMMASATGCGENTTWSADIDGSRIPAGVFIYYLQNAYYDAEAKISENTATTTEDGAAAEPVMVFDSVIEDKNAKQWIYDEATKSVQEYAAVEAKFAEYGLSLTAEEQEAAEIYCDQLWDYGGEFYNDMGISQKSYLSIHLNSEKKNKLFTAIYGEGGEKAVSDDEIKAYLDENYAMINYIEMELKDGEGNLLKSDGKAERMAMAEEFVERYNNGEDFDSLNAEYVAFYDNLKAEAAAAAEEAADTDTDTDNTLSAEIIPSDAQAPLDGEGDVLTESGDSAAPADASPAETTVSEVSAPVTEAVTTAAVTETAAETEAPSALESIPDDVSQINAVSSNQTVIEKDGSTPDTAVAKAVFEEMNKGEIKIIESANGEFYYVVLKQDIIGTDEYFNSAKDSLLYEMKSEELDELISQWTQAQSVSRNQEAYDRYDPEKMFKTE